MINLTEEYNLVLKGREVIESSYLQDINSRLKGFWLVEIDPTRTKIERRKEASLADVKLTVYGAEFLVDTHRLDVYGTEGNILDKGEVLEQLYTSRNKEFSKLEEINSVTFFYSVILSYRRNALSNSAASYSSSFLLLLLLF